MHHLRWLCSFLLIGSLTASSVPFKLVQSISAPPNAHFLGSRVVVSFPHMVMVGGDVGNTATAYFYKFDNTTRQFIANSMLTSNLLIGMSLCSYIPSSNTWEVLTQLIPSSDTSYVSPYLGLGGHNRVFLSGTQTVMQVFREDNEVWSWEQNITLPLQLTWNSAWKYYYEGDSLALGAIRWQGDFPSSPEYILLFNFSEPAVFNQTKSYCVNKDSFCPNVTFVPFDHQKTQWSFGRSLAFSKGKMFATAGSLVGNGTNAVSYFVQQGQQWTEMYQIFSQYGSGDGYGTSVSYDEQSSLLAVGAPWTAPSPSPFVYIYKLAQAHFQAFGTMTEENTSAYGNAVQFFRFTPSSSGQSNKHSNPVKLSESNEILYLVVAAEFTGERDKVGPAGEVFVYQYVDTV